MYVNAALGDPFNDEGASWRQRRAELERDRRVEGGGAAHRALRARHLHRDPTVDASILDHYARPDNPLFVPETGNAPEYRALLLAGARQGRDRWSPFGMDATGYSNTRSARSSSTTTRSRPSPPNIALLGADRARLGADRVRASDWGFAKATDAADQSQRLGRWKITAQYGLWAFGERDWTWIEAPPNPMKDQPVGGARGDPARPRQFLVAGSDVRIRFALAAPQPGDNAQILDVEEGTFENGQWVMTRRWNGDQTDYGFNFGQRRCCSRSAWGLTDEIRRRFAIVLAPCVEHAALAQTLSAHADTGMVVTPTPGPKTACVLQVYGDGTIRVTATPTRSRPAAEPDGHGQADERRLHRRRKRRAR